MDLLDQAHLVALGFAAAIEGSARREGDVINIVQSSDGQPGITPLGAPITITIKNGKLVVRRGNEPEWVTDEAYRMAYVLRTLVRSARREQ